MELLAIILATAGISFAGVFWIVSAWFDRRLSGGQAVLLLVGLLSLEFLTMGLAGPGVLLLGTAVFGAGALAWAIFRIRERRLADSFDEEDTARCRAALEFDPKNVAAHSLLGDIHRRRGELEQAIEEYRDALRLDPSLGPERFWVRRLQQDLERRGRRDMACPRCGALRPEKVDACPQCGRLYSSLETAGHALRTMSRGRRAALAALAALVPVGLTVLGARSPKALGIVLLASFCLGCIAAIILSMRARRRTG